MTFVLVTRVSNPLPVDQNISFDICNYMLLYCVRVCVRGHAYLNARVSMCARICAFDVRVRVRACVCADMNVYACARACLSACARAHFRVCVRARDL